MIVILFEP